MHTTLQTFGASKFFDWFFFIILYYIIILYLGCWKYSPAITGLNYISKYKTVILNCNNELLSKLLKYLANPNHLNSSVFKKEKKNQPFYEFFICILLLLILFIFIIIILTKQFMLK